jgi:hypothetical protein
MLYRSFHFDNSSSTYDYVLEFLDITDAVNQTNLCDLFKLITTKYYHTNLSISLSLNMSESTVKRYIKKIELIVNSINERISQKNKFNM